MDDRNPDSLKITPEWHAWLHHNIDDVPTEKPLPKPAYQTPSAGNPTGTSDAYVPPHHRLNKRFGGSASEKYEPWSPSSTAKATEAKQDTLDLK